VRIQESEKPFEICRSRELGSTRIDMPAAEA
jgi:hypothetical protein